MPASVVEKFIILKVLEEIILRWSESDHPWTFARK